MSTPSTEVDPTAVAATSRVRWKIFLLMLTLISINYIDRASLSVAMPLIGREFDLDPAMQGLILSSFFWPYAFMQVPGGMLADRASRGSCGPPPESDSLLADLSRFITEAPNLEWAKA
jgi:ACS family D-galactonate transporter-like MFS transporter